MVMGIMHLLLNLPMVNLSQFQDMISSKVVILPLVTVMWPTQCKRGTLTPKFRNLNISVKLSMTKDTQLSLWTMS